MATATYSQLRANAISFTGISSTIPWDQIHIAVQLRLLQELDLKNPINGLIGQIIHMATKDSVKKKLALAIIGFKEHVADPINGLGSTQWVHLPGFQTSVLDLPILDQMWKHIYVTFVT